MSGCYRCGNSQGSELNLCPECSHAYDAKREALKRNLRVDTDSATDSILNRLLANPRFQANALVVGWYLLTFILVMLGIEVGVPLGVSLVISTMITATLLFLGTLLLAWISLMVFDVVQGLIALVFPFMLYRVFVRMWRFRFVSSEWSNHKGVVLAHVLSIILFLIAVDSISLVGDSAIVRADRLFKRNYGFSPMRGFIAVGIVRKEAAT